MLFARRSLASRVRPAATDDTWSALLKLVTGDLRCSLPKGWHNQIQDRNPNVDIESIVYRLFFVSSADVLQAEEGCGSMCLSISASL